MLGEIESRISAGFDHNCRFRFSECAMGVLSGKFCKNISWYRLPLLSVSTFNTCRLVLVFQFANLPRAASEIENPNTSFFQLMASAWRKWGRLEPTNELGRGCGDSKFSPKHTPKIAADIERNHPLWQICHTNDEPNCLRVCASKGVTNLGI